MSLKFGNNNLYVSAVLFFVFSTIGCKTEKTTLKTFVDPAMQTNAIGKVVIFPMRNTALDPGEALEINRDITQTFQRRNPNVKVIGSVDGTKMLNDGGLVDDYSKFLDVFETSGIANTATLKQIGEKLHVDAILQGRLTGVSQRDRGRDNRAETILTVRYTLLSVHNGSTLWEGVSEGRKWRKHGRLAPPLYEVITIALKKILSQLPTLGQ